jgi:hypothetical protein
VWDVVDAWPQPEGNNWEASQAMRWLSGMINEIRPAAMVAATAKMAEDIATVFKGPVLWLPHHARPGLNPQPVRPHVRTIGYEGGFQYLGRWYDHITRWCGRHHVEFAARSEFTPAEYHSLDIVLALRDFNGYPARNWKSNVKLANAQAAGLPCVVSHERGYLEMVTGAEKFVLGSDRHELLYQALDSLLPYDVRLVAQAQHAAHTVQLERIAKSYREWLWSLKF